MEAVHEKDELPNYVKNGRVTGYHFLSHNSSPPKKVTLDPEKFGQNAHSRAEVRTASLPRVFFYVDLRDKESYFSMAPLYKAEMEVKFIYSLVSDPLKIYENLSDEGHRIGSILYFLKEYGYHGVYYQVPSMRLVNWFYPIEATLADEANEMSHQRETLNKSKEDSSGHGFDYDSSIHDTNVLKTHMNMFNRINKSGGLTQREMEQKLADQEKWEAGEGERLKQRELRRAKGMF